MRQKYKMILVFLFTIIMIVMSAPTTVKAAMTHYSPGSGSCAPYTLDGLCHTYSIDGVSNPVYCNQPKTNTGNVEYAGEVTNSAEACACAQGDPQMALWTHNYPGTCGSSGATHYGSCTASASANLSLGEAKLHYNSDKSYLVSNAIGYSGTSASISVSAPGQAVSGANGDGSVITSTGNATLYIRVPVANANETGNVSMNATSVIAGTKTDCTDPGTSYTAKYWNGASAQNMVECVTSSTAGGCVTNSCSDTKSSSVTVHVPKGTLVITKVDSVDGYKLQNAKFKLYESDGTTPATYVNRQEIPELVSDANGTISVSNLYPGEYVIKELEPPQYYKIIDEYTNISIADGQTTPVTIKDEPLGRFTLIKIDDKSLGRLDGVVFGLYDESGQRVTKDAFGKNIGSNDAGDIVTNIMGQVKVEDLHYGTYYLKEIKNPEGYEVISESIKVVINNINFFDVTIENVAIKIPIYKKSFHTKEPLKGATITVTDINNDKLYQEFITTEDKYELWFVPGDYVLTEVIGADGYMVLDENVIIHIDAMGKITLETSEEDSDRIETIDAPDYGSKIGIVIYNEKTKLKISKQDIANSAELPGAHIVITDKDGNVVKDSVTGEDIDFVSTDKPSEFYIDPGEYELKETAAPEGESEGCLAKVEEYKNAGYNVDSADCSYEPIANSLKFKIDEQGNVSASEDQDPAYFFESNRITLYNGSIPVPVPDTGVFVSIITIFVGAAMIFVGYKFMKENKEKRI